jgi:uncharacterized protein
MDTPTPPKRPRIVHRVAKRRWTLLGALAASLTLAWTSGCTALHEKQGAWIFNPSQGSWGNSAQAARGMTDVWIDYRSALTDQAVRLHALWAPAPSPNAPVLMYLHGARWNVNGSAFRIQRMQALGFSVLAVDYRGFGKTSQETPSEGMAYEDAHAAWQWLAREHADKARFIFGHSLGGAVAIELATQVSDERGTIVEGTFTSIPDVFKTMRWGWLPVSGLITQRFESIDKVARIGSPLLVVHGANDALVAPALGRKLYEAAAEPKRFVLVEGGSHHNTNAVGQQAYRVALRDLFGL